MAVLQSDSLSRELVHQSEELAAVKAMLGCLLSTPPRGCNHLLATVSALTPADKLNVEVRSCAVASRSQQNDRTQVAAEDDATEQIGLSSAGMLHTISDCLIFYAAVYMP